MLSCFSQDLLKAVILNFVVTKSANPIVILQDGVEMDEKGKEDLEMRDDE